MAWQPPIRRLILPESVLYAKTSLRVMPGQRPVRAGDEASPTFQTTLVFRLDLALPVQSIHLGRANVQAVTNLTLGLADLLVDGNVGLGVKLKDIQAQLGFNVHAILPRSSAAPADP
jgi:hypothetical protein